MQLKHSLWPLLLLCLTLNAWAGEDRPVILVMGDSLSAGYGIDIDESWVNLLRERLEGDYPHEVVNASVSGETSRGGLARLPALLGEHGPELVILELGGNDGLRGQPLNTLRDNLAQMIATSREAGARVLLLGMKIPPNYGRRYTSQFEALYPALAENHDVPLVAFFLEGVAGYAEVMQRDNIHPKAEGQPKMLDNVWPELKPLLVDQN